MSKNHAPCHALEPQSSAWQEGHDAWVTRSEFSELPPSAPLESAHPLARWPIGVGSRIGKRGITSAS